MSNEALSNLLREERRFAPPAALAAAANVTADAYERPRPTGWVLGRAGPAAELGDRPDPDAGLVEPAVRQVVRRRQAQRRLQLRRPPCRGRQRRPGRHPLRGRARRQPRHHLRRAQGRGLPGRQRADRARRHRRRPGRGLPADDPRGRRRDARLRPDRRRALRGLRRLLRRRRAPPGSTTPTRSSSSPPTAATGAASSALKPDRRRRPWPAPQVEHVLVVRRTGQDVAWTEGRDVWWHEISAPPVHRAHPGGVRRRAPAVHPLHLRHHG